MLNVQGEPNQKPWYMMSRQLGAMQRHFLGPYNTQKLANMVDAKPATTEHQTKSKKTSQQEIPPQPTIVQSPIITQPPIHTNYNAQV